MRPEATDRTRMKHGPNNLPKIQAGKTGTQARSQPAERATGCSRGCLPLGDFPNAAIINGCFHPECEIKEPDCEIACQRRASGSSASRNVRRNTGGERSHPGAGERIPRGGGNGRRAHVHRAVRRRGTGAPREEGHRRAAGYRGRIGRDGGCDIASVCGRDASGTTAT